MLNSCSIAPYTALCVCVRMKVRTGFLPLRAATPLSHVFGGDLLWAWLPVDPTFPRPEEVLHYRLVDQDYSSLA